MGIPIAWFRNSPNGRYSIFYVDPSTIIPDSEYDSKDYIPLYEGWKESYDAIANSIDSSKKMIYCNEYGEFYSVDIIDQEFHDEVLIKEQDVWSTIAESIADGINLI